MKIITSPIKSQGIKTKLIPFINDLIYNSNIDLKQAQWIEPFFGTGVVGFNNPLCGKHLVSDTNPYIINFYNRIQSGIITPDTVRDYLQYEGKNLLEAGENGYEHYKNIRDRFNTNGDLLDFLFLSRSGFNGLMRFNKRGFWNVPFCKKQNRFSPAYITKICNQVKNVAAVIHSMEWEFIIADFEKLIQQAVSTNLIYCDPPYFGRCADYYNSWTEADERRLYENLKSTSSKFILSTWHHNNTSVNF